MVLERTEACKKHNLLVVATYKSSKEDGVAQVGSHLTSLSDGTGNDSGGSSSESKLEEESNEFRSSRKVADEKVGGTNEALASRVVSSVGKGITDSVETNGTTTGVQQVLQHNVLDILLAHRSGTKHGKSGLHQKDGSTSEQEEKDVQTVNDSGNGSSAVPGCGKGSTSGDISGDGGIVHGGTEFFNS